jgi:hypothetical protein
MRTGSRALPPGPRPVQAPKSQPSPWRDLRDDAGHLYGRINRRESLLELKKNRRTVYLNLITLELFDEKGSSTHDKR